MQEGEQRKKQLMEILLCLDSICKQHGLTYYLTAGSLLGAVRHKGFIPWDNDIDIAMPKKDYCRLTKICRKSFPKGYFFQDWKTEKEYPFRFIKIRKNGTYAEDPLLKNLHLHQGLYVDIFPLERCPDSQRIAKIYFKLIAVITFALIGKSDKEFLNKYVNSRTYLLLCFLTKFHRTVLNWMREIICRIMGFAWSGKRLCTVSGRHGYPRECYQTEWFEKTTEVEFEEYRFPAPIGWDALLRNMYGDYTIPVREEGHFNEVGME